MKRLFVILIALVSGICFGLPVQDAQAGIKPPTFWANHTTDLVDRQRVKMEWRAMEGAVWLAECSAPVVGTATEMSKVDARCVTMLRVSRSANGTARVHTGIIGNGEGTGTCGVQADETCSFTFYGIQEQGGILVAIHTHNYPMSFATP